MKYLYKCKLALKVLSEVQGDIIQWFLLNCRSVQLFSIGLVVSKNFAKGKIILIDNCHELILPFDQEFKLNIINVIRCYSVKKHVYFAIFWKAVLLW